MNRKLLALAGAGVAAGAVALSACSSVQPSLGEYAIVTGHGSLSSTQVQRVVPPGVTYNTSSGTTTWFVPAQGRNFVSGPGGDRPVSKISAEITGPGSHGEDGMSDVTYTSVFFELNPRILSDKTFASNFVSFCLKYGCASNHAQNDASNSAKAHSSTTGWNNMLGEIMPNAIDNATQVAVKKFGPDLWTDQSNWPALARDIAADLPAEIKVMTNDPPIPYFCGPGATLKKCTPPTVSVNHVYPSDPGVQTAYNQQQTALYAKTANQAQIAAARVKYGNQANFWLGAQDFSASCRQGATCNLYIGTVPGSPGSK